MLVKRRRIQEQSQVPQTQQTRVPDTPEVEKGRRPINSAKKSHRKPLFVKVGDEKKNIDEVIDLDYDEDFGFI